MNDDKWTTEGDGKDMDDIGQLIRYAGARELVSSERLEKARARVGDHWQGIVEAQRRERWQSRLRVSAIAASIVVVIGIAFLTWQRPPEMTSVATVARVVGDVRIDGRAIRSEDSIAPGSVIETAADGRLALTLTSGQSLRIDTATRLVAQSGNRFSLGRGGVYVDSGATGSAAPVWIETHLGTASDVGTQFQVRVSPDTLLIGVREGLVALQWASGASVSVDKGHVFELTTSGDERRREVDPDDEIWDWTAAIAPEFDIDGATLYDYLQWYTREQGIRLEWQGDASRRNAERIFLSGSIRGLSLDEGLQAVLKIAPFDYEHSGDTFTARVD